MWSATVAIATLYIGTTVLTPLYPMYEDAFGISPLTITIIYAVYVVGNLAVLFLFGRLSDQVGRRAHSASDLDLRPRIGVPADIRLAFVAPACMAFAAFALGGFFSALVPGIIKEELHLANVAAIGVVVTLFFAVAGLTAALTRKLTSWTAMFAGAVCVFPGVALLSVAESLRSFILLFVAAGVGGAAMALSYRGSLQVVNESARKSCRLIF